MIARVYTFATIDVLDHNQLDPLCHLKCVHQYYAVVAWALRGFKACIVLVYIILNGKGI